MMVDVLGGARTTKVAVRTLVDGTDASRVIRPIQTEVCACGMTEKSDADAHVGPVYARGFAVSSLDALQDSTERRVVLLLNTRNQTNHVSVTAGEDMAEGRQAFLSTVDFEHGVRTQPYSNVGVSVGADGRVNVSLGGFAVALLVLPPTA